MLAALAYEWQRIRSIRSTWWLAGGSVVATAIMAFGYSGVVRSMLSSGVEVDGLEATVLVVSKASMATIVAGILGVCAVGNDYRYGTMRTTLLVIPRRTVALAAKSLVVTACGAALTVVNLAVAWVVGSLVLVELPPDVGGVPGFLQLHLGQVVLVSAWALVGIAVTVLTRSQLWGMAVLLLVPFVVEPMFRTVGMLSGQGWLETVAGYLPFSAGEAITDISSGAVRVLLAPESSRVGPLAGGAILLGTVGVLWAAALVRFRRQDA